MGDSGVEVVESVGVFSKQSHAREVVKADDTTGAEEPVGDRKGHQRIQDVSEEGIRLMGGGQRGLLYGGAVRAHGGADEGARAPCGGNAQGGGESNGIRGEGMTVEGDA